MTADSQPTPGAPPAGTYRIDAQQSTVTYSGRHLFGLAGVTATFRITSGEMVIAEPISASTVTVTVDAASFTSDKPKRDTHVRSAALLDTATYPEITFTSDGLRPRGDGWLLSGAVTAHGTAVPVELAVDRPVAGPDGVHVHARVEHLDRYAFGVTKVKGMAGRYLDLDLDVQAARE